MTLVRVAAPAKQAVDMTQVTEVLRLDTTALAEIMAYIDKAIAGVDGADGWLGRALITQTWDLKLTGFPVADWRTPWAEIEIPLPPLQSVTSITYVATDDGSPIVLDPSAYQVAGIGASQPAKVVPVYGTMWPAAREQLEAVTVRFATGYGDSPADVPASIRHALTLMVGDMVAHRESSVVYSVEDTGQVAEFLRPYRVWTL